GGGYEFISYREKDPIMFAFNALGYQSFSLSYSCHTLYPVPYLELMCALHYLNTHHNELGIVPKEITLIGFSAGGHLAASYAGIYQKLNRFDDISLIKPFALVLAYPVISLIKSDNPQCIKNITNFDDKLRHLLSADERVSKEYPPTFMWTSKTDQMVNPKNVSWLKKALDEKKVKNKCMIYSSGGHGLALANYATWCHNPDWINKEASKWPTLAHQFIQKL
ncbi:MAG: alpha/beta hydrolase, partial [Bacilli bacterium]|nr:alpha/beta hydrolase [Bacilli bacterium]